MANYTKKFQKPYADGYKDRPDTSTPVTADVKNAETNALLAIEEYLAQNKITSVSIDGLLNEGYSIAIVEVDGKPYNLNIPELYYQSAITGGTKIGKITLGEKSYDLYVPAASAGGSITIDAALSTESTNPVQNKVVNAALENKMDKSLETLIKYEREKTGTLTFTTTEEMTELIASYASIMNNNFALAFNSILMCTQFKNYLSVSSIDCDLLTDYKAIYFVNGSAETNNLPTGFGGGILLNSKAGSTSAATYQYCMDFTNGKQHSRYYRSGAWSEWTKTNESGGSVVVDSELSDSSTNPVQNKVIAKKIKEIEEKVSIKIKYEITFTSSSTGPAGKISTYLEEIEIGSSNFNYDTGINGISLCSGLLQWYYPDPDGSGGSLKLNKDCYVNGDKVSAGEYIFKERNYTELYKYSYSISADDFTLYSASNAIEMTGISNFKSKIALADTLSMDQIILTKDSADITVTAIEKKSDTEFKLTADFSGIVNGDNIKIQTAKGFLYDPDLTSLSNVPAKMYDGRFLVEEPKLDGTAYLTLLYNQAGYGYYATKRAEQAEKYWAIGVITYCGVYTVPLIVSDVSDYACVTSTYMGNRPTSTYTFEYDGKTYYCNSNVQGANTSSLAISNESIPLYDVHDTKYTDNEAGCVYMAKKLLDFYFGKEDFPQ